MTTNNQPNKICSSTVKKVTDVKCGKHLNESNILMPRKCRGIRTMGPILIH